MSEKMEICYDCIPMVRGVQLCKRHEAAPASPSEPSKCGTTHYAGCACHEAKRDAELEELRGRVARMERIEQAAEGVIKASRQFSGLQASLNHLEETLNATGKQEPMGLKPCPGPITED